MNIQLLQHVKHHIEQHPERFCAAQWAWARNAGAVIDQDETPVDFRCCIAGHVLLLSRRFDESSLLRHSVQHDDGYLARCAQETLGLTDEQRRELFYPSLWTDPYRSDYYLTTTREDEARVCAGFLGHFIDAHEGQLDAAEDRPALTHQVHHLARPTRSVAAFQ